MIKKITNPAPCSAYIGRYHADPRFFGQPTSKEQALLKVEEHISKRDEITLGAFDDGVMTGLFTFLLIEEEKYAELLLCVCDDGAAYDELLSYLCDNYAGYEIYFVYNPENSLLTEKLAERKAEFFEEQYKMSYSKKPCAADTGGVKLLTPEYEADYVEMHNKDLYWTGDRVIGAKDRFRTYIALENGVLCGYIDVTFNHEENEIFDLLVKPEYRNRGYGKRLLCKALEENEPNGMILTVNVGNEAALHVYRTVGFETVEHENSLTALFEA